MQNEDNSGVHPDMESLAVPLALAKLFVPDLDRELGVQISTRVVAWS